MTPSALPDTLFCSPLKLLIDDSVAMTPFYLLLGKHRQQQQESQEVAGSVSTEKRPLPQGSVAIKEVSCVGYIHFVVSCRICLNVWSSQP